MHDVEIPFEDGNVSGAVRIGQTVRPATGPWTPAVHALLRHLESVRFMESPRVLGIDAMGRESLTFLPGKTAPASLDGFESDEVLVGVADLLRRYHDAVRGFLAPKNAEWRITVGAPTSGEIVCHCDVAPWNVTFVDGRPTGLIDWDFAAPGPMIWDVAYALWRFVPLYPDDRYGSPAERARRIRLFCDAYGLSSRGGLLDVVGHRQRVLYDTLKTWGKAGVPGFVEMWRDGHGEIIQQDIAYVERHRQALQAHISAC
jgi:hypothetical protein